MSNGFVDSMQQTLKIAPVQLLNYYHSAVNYQWHFMISLHLYTHPQGAVTTAPWSMFCQGQESSYAPRTRLEMLLLIPYNLVLYVYPWIHWLGLLVNYMNPLNIIICVHTKILIRVSEWVSPSWSFGFRTSVTISTTIGYFLLWALFKVFQNVVARRQRKRLTGPNNI